MNDLRPGTLSVLEVVGLRAKQGNGNKLVARRQPVGVSVHVALAHLVVVVRHVSERVIPRLDLAVLRKQQQVTGYITGRKRPELKTL